MLLEDILDVQKGQICQMRDVEGRGGIRTVRFKASNWNVLDGWSRLCVYLERLLVMDEDSVGEREVLSLGERPRVFK